ncbi:carboxylate-amine ligase RHA1_ro04240 [Arthrobacter sp. Hiyo8]|nr:carboxylate-amine ligase RHA1_ro04240 [Arthrobacter sp. Hiyo8]
MRNFTTETEPTPVVKPWLDDLLPELLEFRRDLHAHPELSFKEFRTTDKLVERLEAAGLEPRRLEGSGLTVDVGDGPIATACAETSTPSPSSRRPGFRSRRRTMASPTRAGMTSTPRACLALRWCCTPCTRNPPWAERCASSSSRQKKPCPAVRCPASSRACSKAFRVFLRCTAIRVSTSARSARVSAPSPRRRTPSKSN